MRDEKYVYDVLCGERVDDWNKEVLESGLNERGRHLNDARVK